MKYLKYLFLVQAGFFLFAPAVSAGDFEWIKELNIEVKGDSSGFKTRLTTRFKVGDVQLKAVFSNVDRPADAYMVLRLGELSNQPVEDVLREYKKSKGKGWGVVAKGLGIKPGSKAFHALKAGHDLKGGTDKGGGKNKERKGKGRGKK